MKVFTAIAGQSIYDVCLQTYGTLDYLYKLMQDNGVNGLDAGVLSGQKFKWDDSLVLDQQINAAFAGTDTFYATSTSNGSVFFVNINGSGGIVQPPGRPALPNTTNTYQVVYSTHFTSGADGTTTATITDINGQPIIGYDIVQIENEIKPLKNTDYSWNKNNAQLTLLNGLTVDNGATLFVLYSKIVTTP